MVKKIIWPNNLSEKYGKLNKTGELLAKHIQSNRNLLVDEGVCKKQREITEKDMRTEIVRYNYLKKSRRLR